METRGGVECIYTGANGSRITRKENGHTFVEVQLLPLTPQRIVWVNELNLKGAPKDEPRGLGGIIRTGAVREGKRKGWPEHSAIVNAT